MKVALSTHGRFHSFDLARQLVRHGAFGGIWTGYPMSKVAGEGLPPGTVHAVPALYLLARALARIPATTTRVQAEADWYAGESLDAATQRGLPSDADALIALSGGGLGAGRALQKRGGVYLCDRGSTHIAFQQEVLREEYAAYGHPFKPFFPRMVAKEEAEYMEADAVLTPTRYTAQTFIDRGVPPERVKRAPYGVDLGRFFPGEGPPERLVRGAVRGGALDPKGRPLPFGGLRAVRPSEEAVDPRGQRPRRDGGPRGEGGGDGQGGSDGHPPARGRARADGPKPRHGASQRRGGLGARPGQALACGCPVIATPPTGCEDLYEDGEQGFVVPLQDSGAIADRLTRLADEPELRDRMAAAAVERVKALGGWDRYGDVVMGHLRDVMAAKLG